MQHNMRTTRIENWTAGMELLVEKGKRLEWGNANTGHNKLFRLFHMARRQGLPKDQAIVVAYHLCGVYNVGYATGDLERQCGRAYGLEVGTSGWIGPSLTRMDEQVDRAALDRIIQVDESFSVDDLVKRSPLDPTQCSLSIWLAAVYSNANIGRGCILVTDRFNATKPKALVYPGEAFEPFRSDEGGFFVINPVTGYPFRHERFASGESWRCNECVLRFSFMLIESDKLCLDDQVKLLASLEMPIVSIVSSGGRSLHALVKIGAKTEAEWREIRDEYVSTLGGCGIDRNVLRPNQMSRLPFCIRGNKNSEQQLLFLNPFADGTPIHRLNCRSGS